MDTRYANYCTCYNKVNKVKQSKFTEGEDGDAHLDWMASEALQRR